MSDRLNGYLSLVAALAEGARARGGTPRWESAPAGNTRLKSLRTLPVGGILKGVAFWRSIEGFVKDLRVSGAFLAEKAKFGYRERGFPYRKLSTFLHFDMPLDLID